MNVAFHVPTTLLAGLLGMVAMELAMWLITRSGWAQGNMIVALGSLFTRTRQNAFGVGLVAHTVAAVFFAELYLLGMLEFGLVGWPVSLFTGIGFGLLHGMVVTLTLVWIVADHHPLEEFQEAGLAVGVSHIAGHVAYGAVVGAVIGLSLR